MKKLKVLFACIHNSARSQMAEELLRAMAGDRFDVESAGFEPGKLNPIVVEVLQDEGIDISGKATQGIFDLYKAGRLYDYVITVCDESSAERCPVFPGVSQRVHWSFTDPSSFVGSHAEKLAQTKAVKEQIRTTLQQWITTVH